MWAVVGAGLGGLGAVLLRRVLLPSDVDVGAGDFPELERLEIQGNLLRPYALPFACHFFLRIEDCQCGRVVE